MHLIPGLCLLLAPCLFPTLAGDPVDDLARAFREGRAAGAGSQTGGEAIAESLAALGKAHGGVDPLRLPVDIARAHWLSLLPSKPGFKPGRIEETRVQDPRFGAEGLEYAFRVPRDYESEGAGFPLIITLPIGKSSPAEHLRSTWSEREILSSAILLAAQMPSDPEAWDKVTHRGLPGGIAHVLTALRAAQNSLAINPNRIFVLGHGVGAPAALAIGNHSPQHFAGIVLRSGDPGQLAPDNLGNLPVLLAACAGTADDFEAASKALGHEGCSIQRDPALLSVWKWMKAQRRVALPNKVTLVPGNPFPTRAYWLRVTPIADSPRVSATVDRMANSITVDGIGVSSVTFYLNDSLVDLERPLTINHGGSQRELQPRRSWKTCWQRIEDGTSDTGCVYTAEVVVDMSPDAAASPGALAAAPDPEFDESMNAAGADPARLWAAFQWCGQTQRETKSSYVLHKLLRVAPDHELARAALGNVRHDGRWFSTQAKLDRFLLTQDEVSAKAKGHVLHKGRWVHKDDRSLSNKSERNLETGLWYTRKDIERLAKGWMRQDLEWIEPDYADEVDRGLWRVDGEWYDLASANLAHSQLDSMWVIPDAEVRLHASLDREICTWALSEMSHAMHDLRRVFGAEPQLPLDVAMLRDQEQYDRLAFGATSGRRPPATAGRMNMVHHAFFAESLFGHEGGKPVFDGMGVGYWEAHAPYGNAYGVHAARLAVGLSYVAALDPSPKAVRRALKAKATTFDYYSEYESEKSLPTWLLVGGAVYAERYFYDATVDTSVQSDPPPDPFWARTWTLQNLANHGNLRPLDQVFAFDLNADDRPDAQQLLIETGLLVSFLLDGDCEPATEAHTTFKRELAAGRLKASGIRALEDVLREHELELRAYAGE
ncbi:MAG: poly(3-hydroxybutyrate) depolymerase [Planctomycetota bacterium]|jgi:poly(3-hydroxybutyrate) depolymerase